MSESKEFRIPLIHQKQQLDYDCWATCLAMICDWKGVDLTRSRLWNEGHLRFPQSTELSGMLSVAEWARLVRELSGGKISFTRIGGGLGGTKIIITWEVYKSYLNQFRPILITMHRHCWIVSGYKLDGTQRMLVHNVAKPTGPDEAGVRYLNQNTKDVAILDVPLPTPLEISVD